MDPSELFRDWRDASLQSWTRMMTATVESTEFIDLMSSSTQNLLGAQKKARELQLAMLDAAGMPSRTALADLAHRAQMAEKRALDAEDRLEALNARLSQIQGK
ncbi:MAG TPA: hypothetical protein VGO93_26270 [Candidatus Xenobia bacterium]|jgi:hypothetical protein